MMNDNEQKKNVQDAMNRSLCGLQENPLLAQRIIAESKGGQFVVKKRISIGFVFALVAVFVTVSALAIGLVFSPQYDAKRLANQTLKDQYGITDEMMTILHRSDAGDEPDGSQVFMYEPIEDIYAKQIGVFTVTVKDGKGHAVWSHDGEDTSGGIQANAWGAEQIAMLCSEQYSDVLAKLSEGMDGIAATTAPQSDQEPILVDKAAVAEAEAYFQAQQAAWEKDKAQVEAASKISFEEALNLAISAISGEFGLSSTQCDQLVLYDDVDGVTYRFMDDQPVVDLFFHLTQKDDGSFTRKDGIYVVTVNMDLGVIEDILYDSGLAGNG